VAKVEKKRAVSEHRLRDFLQEMLLIRRFEEKVEERFRAGELPGFLHVAIGQEAAEVGVCAAMEDGDVFGSTHRAHGHTLARGTHQHARMAELYGKIEGCSHGYGGSMHLYDVERGNLGANAVVGGGLPSLVGAGLAFKLRDEPRVAVAFFGDGATNTGTFHESLNLAQLWKTKTLFVCENNSWAESTPGWQHSPVWEDMSKRALAYDMHSIKVDGQDVEEVYEKATEALDYVRSGRGPVFLDVETYRMHGHYRRPAGLPLAGRPRGGARARRSCCSARDSTPPRTSGTPSRKRSPDRRGAVEFAKAGPTPSLRTHSKNIYA
jgi:pyruvate dehydrogenase E1 component alpha subunit